MIGDKLAPGSMFNVSLYILAVHGTLQQEQPMPVLFYSVVVYCVGF